MAATDDRARPERRTAGMPIQTTPPVNELAAATPLAVTPRIAAPVGSAAEASASAVGAGEPPVRLCYGSAGGAAGGARFYKRILSYFAGDVALIVLLVALIWV